MDRDNLLKHTIKHYKRVLHVIRNIFYECDVVVKNYYLRKPDDIPAEFDSDNLVLLSLRTHNREIYQYTIYHNYNDKEVKTFIGDGEITKLCVDGMSYSEFDRITKQYLLNSSYIIYMEIHREDFYKQDRNNIITAIHKLNKFNISLMIELKETLK